MMANRISAVLIPTIVACIACMGIFFLLAAHGFGTGAPILFFLGFLIGRYL